MLVPPDTLPSPNEFTQNFPQQHAFIVSLLCACCQNEAKVLSIRDFAAPNYGADAAPGYIAHYKLG